LHVLQGLEQLDVEGQLTFSALEIPFSGLTDLTFIASGGFGKVYKAKFRGEDVAVKLLGSISLSPEDLEAFRQEVKNINSIRSRFVVNFYGACTKQPNLAMVMELMTGGSLSNLLRSPTKELPWDVRLHMIEEIAMGIKVLHRNNPTILHCDLKSGNILLDEHRHCKLADFGFAIVKEDSISKSVLSSQGGTLAWMAPELFSLRPKFSTKSDIYAFGVIMWEVATRKFPYQGALGEVIRYCVLHGEREDVPDGCPNGYTDLMQKCWDQEPANRPTIDEILDQIVQIKQNFVV